MTPASEGNWILRSMDAATGKETYNALGDFSEMPTHQRYDSAQQTAMRQIDHINKGGITTVKTIRDACNNYVAHLGQAKTCKSANDAERRFKTYVLNLEPFAALGLR